MTLLPLKKVIPFSCAVSDCPTQLLPDVTDAPLSESPAGEQFVMVLTTVQGMLVKSLALRGPLAVVLALGGLIKSALCAS
jgi:hypothetical protein